MVKGMDTQQVPATTRPRPRDRVLVIPDLADLHGPSGGMLTLPLWLRWQENRTFDLDKPAMRQWVYEIVLREASATADLTEHLNAAVLTEVWPRLFLPRPVQAAWESQHPQLQAAAPAVQRCRGAARPRPAAGRSVPAAAGLR